MIISVNGREKKIAILENGRVTEFYIERGEENSGVVGNIYKGRVQRVLPGMQSAFVGIGLERDAFLYVSDFFDEEEEIERIIQEKSKKVPAEQVERAVSDELHRARLEREKQMEAAQEIAEPLAAGGAKPERNKQDSKANFAEEEEVEIIELTNEEALAVEAERRGKSRRNRKGKENEAEGTSETFAPEPVETLETEPFEEPLLFETEDSSFERIIDDEETTGEVFKDAFIQEAIVDQVRAIEFDMESTTTAEVGSLFDESTSDGGFERIADEEAMTESEETSAGPPTKNKRKGSTRDSKKSKKKEEAAKAKAEKTKKEKPVKPIEENVEKSGEKPEKPKSTRGRKSKKASEEETSMKDEASVLEKNEVAEMAVRRGRRRGGAGRNQNRSQQEERPENQGRNGGEEMQAEPENGHEQRSGRNDNGGRRDSRDNRRSQPTITDLLREGQDVLVQIAKEPIARKGARITSHIALPGRYIVYMPTIEHLGVSRKIESSNERNRLRSAIIKIRGEESIPSGGFIVRTAGIGVSEQDLRDDARYLVRTWLDIKKQAEKSKSPALVHQDLDLTERLLRDQLSNDFTAIRIDSEDEYLKIVEFVNRIQPRMVNRVKLYTRDEPILEAYNVQEEVDKALKPRVWLKSGGYLVINQTEALVSIDVNTGKFVGKGNARLEDTITRTNMEAVEEIARQIRLRDLGGIIVLDLIDMEDRRNRHKVMQTLQEALQDDKSPTKVLSFNDFGLVIMTRKRVKQSLERTMCSPCSYCQGAGLVKSAQTVCYEILDEARRLSKGMDDVRQTTLRVNPEVAKALRDSDRIVLEEIEAYLGVVDLTSDPAVHQEQFDFAFI